MDGKSVRTRCLSAGLVLIIIRMCFVQAHGGGEVSMRSFFIKHAIKR